MNTGNKTVNPFLEAQANGLFYSLKHHDAASIYVDGTQYEVRRSRAIAVVDIPWAQLNLLEHQPDMNPNGWAAHGLILTRVPPRRLQDQGN